MNREKDMLFRIKEVFNREDVQDSNDIVSMKTLKNIIETKFNEIDNYTDFSLLYYFIKQKIEDLGLYDLSIIDNGIKICCDNTKFKISFSFSINNNNFIYSINLVKYKGDNYIEFNHFYFKNNYLYSLSNKDRKLIKESKNIVLSFYKEIIDKSIKIEKLYDEMNRTVNDIHTINNSICSFLSNLEDIIYLKKDDLFIYRIKKNNWNDKISCSISLSDTKLFNKEFVILINEDKKKFESIKSFINEYEDCLLKKIGIHVEELDDYYKYLIQEYFKGKENEKKLTKKLKLDNKSI